MFFVVCCQFFLCSFYFIILKKFKKNIKNIFCMYIKYLFLFRFFKKCIYLFFSFVFFLLLLLSFIIAYKKLFAIVVIVVQNNFTNQMFASTIISLDDQLSIGQIYQIPLRVPTITTTTITITRAIINVIIIIIIVLTAA